jgi:hypothetical protein
MLKCKTFAFIFQRSLICVQNWNVEKLNFWKWCCRNLSLRLATKARACKGVGQEWSLGVTFHTRGSFGECDEMNPHTPKWTLILGVGLPNLHKAIIKVKLIRLNSPLYHWKTIGMKMSKMGSHDPFGYIKHKLWPKEGSGVKLPILTPNH